MFKEYKLRDILRYAALDIPFYIVGCIGLNDYIGCWNSGIVFIILCLISFERARSELQGEQIEYLNKELENIKSELRNYKEQILER
jgi:hypothetical protein